MPWARCGPTCAITTPNGSACARWLAQAGHDVLLVDQHPLGRDKTCGDGLIPDAHHALQRLGVLDAVMARAERVSHVGCIGPRGGRIDWEGQVSLSPIASKGQLKISDGQLKGVWPYVRDAVPLVR